MFKVGDELLYEEAGIYVTVTEVYDYHMVVEDVVHEDQDAGWCIDVPESEYELYTLVEDEA